MKNSIDKLKIIPQFFFSLLCIVLNKGIYVICSRIRQIYRNMVFFLVCAIHPKFSMQYGN